MSTIDSKQAKIFVAVLIFVALLVNYVPDFIGGHRAPSPPPASQPSGKQSASVQSASIPPTATNEHDKYIARYLTGSIPRQNGTRLVALVAATETGKLNFTVANALTHRLANPSIQISSSLFTPEFITDGLLKDAASGSRDLFSKLGITNSVDTLVLAQEDVKYSQTTELENLVTATITLNVTAVPVSGQSDTLNWTFTAYGPGFSKEVSRKAAEERIVKQIADDTKMSLH